MTKEQIYKDFHYMFVTDKRNPISLFGIEIGKGWLKLLYELCTIIKKMDSNKSFRFTQIKEKFGILRIYHNSNHDELISLYERKSSKICEECGKPGKLREVNKWLFTACNKHYNKRLC